MEWLSSDQKCQKWDPGLVYWRTVPPAYKAGTNDGTNVSTPGSLESHAVRNETKKMSLPRTPEKGHGSQDGLRQRRKEG
jgi:hypothetical protein